MIPGSASSEFFGAAGAAAGGGAYEVSRSLRFNSADSTYCGRVPAFASNRTTWTFSTWIKRSQLGVVQRFFTGANATNDNNWTALFFNSSDQLVIGGYSTLFRTSNSVYRDCSAWYHLLVVADLGNGTNALKFRAWINNSEVTWSSTGSNPTTTGINSANNHAIGAEQSPSNGGVGSYFNGYLADIYFIDGQVLDPSSFAETDAITGQLIPIAYTGNYGLVSVAEATGALPIFNTTGTYGTIKGTGIRTDANASSLSLCVPMGTITGLSLTDEQPTGRTSSSATLTNTAVTNSTSVSKFYGGSANFNGTTSKLTTSATSDFLFGTGDFTVEGWFNLAATRDYPFILEIGAHAAADSIAFMVNSTGYGTCLYSGGFYGSGAFVQLNQWNHIAWVRRSGTLYIYINGTLSTTAAFTNNLTGTTNGVVIGTTHSGSSIYFFEGHIQDLRVYKGLGKYNSNFSPVSGPNNSFHLSFSDNSTVPTLGTDTSVTRPTLDPRYGMDVITYTGNGSTQTINTLGFAPDFVWLKSRSQSGRAHRLYDTIRGPLISLASSDTGAEQTVANTLSAFTSNGFTLGSDISENNNADTYVAWCWKAGGTAVSNASGSITSNVSANPTYGFSIVTYTGTGANATVGHGLSSAPKFGIVKQRTNSGFDWCIYHSGLTSAAYTMALQSTGAEENNPSTWNSTAPTSTVFSVGTRGSTNASGASLIGYWWSEVPGFSKFGSYTGNGSSTGPTVTLGFKPRYILVKRTDASVDWIIIDSARSPIDPRKAELYPNATASEGANGGPLVFTDTGFTINTNSSSWNASGGTYIYAAYAESPGNNWAPQNFSVTGLVDHTPAGLSYRDSSAASRTWDQSSASSSTSSAIGPDRIYWVDLGASQSFNRITLSVVASSQSSDTSTNFITYFSTSSSSTGSSICGGGCTITSASRPSSTTPGTITVTFAGFASQTGRYIGITNGSGAQGGTYTYSNFKIYNDQGVSNDSLTDTPTSYGTDTGVGGEVKGNYATWNPLDKGSNITFTNGNLALTSTASWNTARATIGLTSGKWYFEYTLSGPSYTEVGVGKSTVSLTTYADGSSNAWVYYSNNGNTFNGGSGTATGATYTTGDVIGVAFDLDSGKIWWAKNGTWLNSGNPGSGTNAAYTNLTSGDSYFPLISVDGTAGTASGDVNFGQRAFAYSNNRSGFKAICDSNLPAPVVAKGSSAMDVVLYTGNGAARNITGLAFNPDLVWIKARSINYDHRLADSVRGVGNELYSNNTSAETTNDSNGYVSAFNSDGFALQSGIGVNGSGNTFVAWTWDAGTSTVTNTAGSITASLRANTSSGFSVVSFTGTGSNATIGHGGLVNLANGMIIVKNRSSATNWRVYHSALGNTKAIFLSTTGTPDTSSVYWNNTSPTSTVFSVGSDDGINGNGNAMVAYCFAPVSGYSSAFSYTGNGDSSGPFVYLGFRPRFIVQKRTDSAGSWLLIDTARDPVNVARNELFANSIAPEFDNTSLVDVLSNGFKIRATFANMNASGGSFIGYAFAENPFQYARAR